jgi:Gram-negative bacterial TonB protein C-terminal
MALRAPCGIAAMAVGLLASPLLAQTAPQPEAFWEDDRWHMSGAGFCVQEPKPLVPKGLDYEAVGETERFGKPGEMWPADSMLMFRADPETLSEDPSQQVVFKFDEMSFLGQRYKSTYAPVISGEKIERAFRAARTLKIVHGTTIIAEFSLRGSARAMDQLKLCTKAKPDMTTVPVPQPIDVRPIVPSPNLTTPLPANRKATPIRPDLWFMPYDIGIREDFTGSTTIGVKMTVSSNGEVASCEVLEPSDHEEVNARTCELIDEFAKFDPATDGNGQAILSTYATKVTF